MKARQRRRIWRYVSLAGIVTLMWAVAALELGAKAAARAAGWALVSIPALVVIMWLYERYVMWSYGRKLRRLGVEEQSNVMAKNLEEARQLLKEMRQAETPTHSLTGQIVDALLGLTLVIIPPMVYHRLSGQPFSAHVSIKLGHIACMFGGFGIYALVRGRLLQRFRL